MTNRPHVFANREEAVTALITNKRSPFTKADRDGLMVMSNGSFQSVLQTFLEKPATRDVVYGAEDDEPDPDEPINPDSIHDQVRGAIRSALAKVRGPFTSGRGSGDSDPAIEAMSAGMRGTAGHPRFGKQGHENVREVQAAHRRAANYTAELSRRSRPQGERASDREIEAMVPPTTTSIAQARRKG